jgi:8-oxo-dGTP diphosphatase
VKRSTTLNVPKRKRTRTSPCRNGRSTDTLNDLLCTPLSGRYLVCMKNAGTFVFFFNNQGYVLLCKRRDKDLWNLPGGTVENGESPWEAALREVHEEIGVTAQLERLTGVYYKPLHDEVVFQFLGTITEGTPTMSDEVADVRYFPPDVLPQNTAPMQAERIRWYAENPSVVRFLTQTPRA